MRAFGGVATYLLTDNERTVTTGYVAGADLRHSKVHDRSHRCPTCTRQGETPGAYRPRTRVRVLGGAHKTRERGPGPAATGEPASAAWSDRQVVLEVRRSLPPPRQSPRHDTT
jgi:hypothetical protein